MAYRLGIIGGGNMGSAIVRGAIASGVLRSAEILVADIDPERRAEYQKSGIATTASSRDAIKSEQILLAIKPQVFPAVAAELGLLPKPQIVISIMAGLHSSAIAKSLGEH